MMEARTFVMLAASAPNARGLRWVHVATEGEWKGHRTGPFQLTEGRFDEAIRNFRMHPRFHQGKGIHLAAEADGRTTGVIAYDLHHASEVPFSAAQAELTLAHAWAHDIEKRRGPDGKWQLFVLTEYLDTARKWIKGGHIAGVSGAFALDAIDPVSGERVGCKLTSIAFTNQPFLTDLSPPVAASAAFTREGPITMSKDLRTQLVQSLRLSANATDDEIVGAVRDTIDYGVKAHRREVAREVDEVIAMHGIDPRMRPTMLSHRLSDPAEFARLYPRTPSTTPDLTRPVSGFVNGGAPVPSQNVRLDSIRVDGGRLVLGQGNAPSNGPNMEFARKLLAVPGENKHARAIALVKQQDPSATHDQAHLMACKLLADNRIPAHIVDVTELV